MSNGHPSLQTPPASFISHGSGWERWAWWIGFLLLLAFSGLVELRSAFQKTHKTDLQVFLRAAWAVRSGDDIYQVTDDHPYHYHYPALLAILLTPLADPPPGVPRDGAVPFAVSVAIWYWFSVACLAWGVQALCRALEETSALPRLGLPAFSKWHALRAIPILVCAIPIGETLSRGQVTLLLLALVCGLIAAILRGRRWQAGFWLAGAICLKIIPAFLLIYPLWRRDLRCLGGCALGLVVGLGVVPGVVLGPERTLGYFQEWTDALLRPALGRGEDQSRAKELINVTGTDSQAPLALLHNGLHADRATRPKEATDAVRMGHGLIIGALTLLTLAAGGWRNTRDPRREALFLGALTLVMILASPVCHLHYFCLSLPLVAGLLAVVLERLEYIRMRTGFVVLASVFFVCSLLPVIPRLEFLRDHGLATYGNLLMWSAALVWLRFGRPVANATSEPQYVTLAA